MIDPKLLRDDPDAVRASQRARGEDEGLVDAILAADRARRDSIMAFDGLRSEQKGLGRQVATATGDEKAALLARTKELSTAVKDAEAAQSAAQTSYEDLLGDCPTWSRARRPAARTTTSCSSTSGEPRTFDFEPRDHLELGQLLGAIDTERGAKVSGARFYYLTGVGALLELALLNLAMAQASRPGSRR